MSIRDVLLDLRAAIVVFLVALPLCLGVAVASGAAPMAGLLAGVVGGVIVGLLSGSHTSVSGPAAGLTAVVFGQITALGSYETFLLAVVLAGLLQIALGLIRAGVLSAFFPTAVINGLLAAIGVILILKQLPHLVGRDADAVGDMSFYQLDQQNTFSEILVAFKDYQLGSLVIGLVSITVLIGWNRIKFLKTSLVPNSLVVVVLGVALSEWFRILGGRLVISPTHLVNIPIAEDVQDFLGFLKHPNFSEIGNQKVWIAAFTIGIIASLETLLNVEAVDKLDTQQRATPRNRELIAQGVGNLVAGLIGAIPVTAVIVRGSVNISAGARTKLASILHGLLLFVAVLFLPGVLNLIPLACLAAILIMTGAKLASLVLFKQMWKQGWHQFVPFLATLISIVLTDLLIGVLIGLMISTSFILWSNLRRPARQVIERHPHGEVIRIILGNQVSFLNKASLTKALNDVPNGGSVLLDASETSYIDPDILQMLQEYRDRTAIARGINVSMINFSERYNLKDQITYVDHITKEFRDELTPQQTLQLLKEGNERFRRGERLYRHLGRQATATAAGQNPMAAILSCIDSRSPAEIIFDMGLGDIFSVRIAGNVARQKVLGSLEYTVAVAGAKLIVVLGHTNCGAINAALRYHGDHDAIFQATNCEHLSAILHDIQASMTPEIRQALQDANHDPEQLETLAEQLTVVHILRMAETIQQESKTIRRMVEAGKIAIVPAIYNLGTKEIRYLLDDSV